MKVVAALVLMLLNVRLSLSCYGEGQILFCLNIPPVFRPGFSSLVMVLKDVGEINSTVFHSDALSNVTRLRMEGADITGIAEEAFRSLQTLTALSLNQNLLSEINPNWFGRPGVLSELGLTENQIEVLDGSMFNRLVNLTRLSLNKNRIREIHPDTFSSQTSLSELDLSDNRMTRVSPQVFRYLRSSTIRLDGNPWDCSCGAEDFVDFLKDLRNRSLLVKPLDVTCESPASLRGRPVWNVSVCVTSPPLGPPSVTESVQPKPTDVLPASTEKLLTTPPTTRPTSESEASAQTKPTDAHTMISSHPATPPSRPTSETKPSDQPKPTDNLTTAVTPTLATGTFATYVTSPPSATETSDHPKPSNPPRPGSTPTETDETHATSRPSSDTSLVCTLVVVIVVLSLLLFVASLLVVLHRRKRNNKTVMPGKENSGQSQSADHSERREITENHHLDTETGWRTSFIGVRAKSANAILFTSNFCAPVTDQVTLKTEREAQSEDTEEKEVGGGSETKNPTKSNDVNVNQADREDKNSHSVSVNSDTVPYLSIGTNQIEHNPELSKQSTDGQNQSSQMGKVMGRISTWPPTATQWQARCKMNEEEQEEGKGSDVFTVWMPKLQGEVKKQLTEEKDPSNYEQDKKEDETQTEESLKMNPAHVNFGDSQSLKPNEKASSFTRPEELLNTEKMVQDSNATKTLNKENPAQIKTLTPAEKRTSKSSGKAELRNETNRAETSRQRAGNRSTGSQAPSGGASPDDETLLSGNEYAFMDLLHEVVQNNGRWTRERWRQTHVNKQRR